MPVHASSVISTALNDFRPDLYTKLTDMENICYTSPSTPGTQPGYQAKFTTMNTSLMTWMNSLRQTQLVDLMPIIYSYVSLVEIYGLSNSQIAASNSRSIYTANNWTIDLLSYADTFYNFATAGPTYGRLDTDITKINNFATQESASITNLKNAILPLMGPLTHKLLFENPVVLSVLTKPDMVTKIFTDLNYNEIYNNFNIGSIPIPPGV
jgi:hypothetical protein